MSQRSQEKRRARSKEKRKERMKMRGRGLLERLGPVDACVCYLGKSGDVDCREVSLTIFRPVRGGGTAAAGFLIDYDCLGLKDAFVEPDADPVAFRQQAQRNPGVVIERISLEKARQLVAAAARWTKEHPFHLPEEAARSLQLIEAQELVAQADTAGFGAKEGGLLYFGRKNDLERRLVGMTVEEFFAQPDHHYMFEVGEEELEEEEDWDDDLEERQEKLMATFEALKDFRGQLLERIKQWCFANQCLPHEHLTDGVRALVEVMLLRTYRSTTAVEEDDETDREFVNGVMSELRQDFSDEEIQQEQEALNQVIAYMQQLSQEQRQSMMISFFDALYAAEN